MIIRKAEKKDARFIAEFLLLAMEDIVYEFLGEENHSAAEQFMLHCVELENSQYSYTNTYVAELDNEVVGAVVLYDGAQLHELRKPVADYVTSITNKVFSPEDETQSGEFYIDSFGVSRKHQGKGIGSKMLEFLIEEFTKKRNIRLGLLVDKKNPSARRLYEKLGFKSVGEKVLVGKEMLHLQISKA